MTALPIPPSIWEQIVAWLAQGRTGTMELHTKDGQVLAATWVSRETVRVETVASQGEQPRHH